MIQGRPRFGKQKALEIVVLDIFTKKSWTCNNRLCFWFLPLCVCSFPYFIIRYGAENYVKTLLRLIDGFLYCIESFPYIHMTQSTIHISTSTKYTLTPLIKSHGIQRDDIYSEVSGVKYFELHLNKPTKWKSKTVMIADTRSSVLFYPSASLNWS
jgi:hypothetical protein